MVRHVVWDWNGTLLADTPLTVDSANAALAHYGAGPITVQYWRDNVTRPTRLTYGRVLGRVVDDALWDEIQELWLVYYKQYVEDTVLAPGALQALERVRSLGWTQSVLSLHDTEVLRTHAKRLGVLDYFALIDAVTPDVPHWKTGLKTAALAAHLDALGVPACEAAMIGDVADDAVSAHTLGAKAVLVTNGDTDGDRLAATGYPTAPSVRGAIAFLEGPVAATTGL